MARNFAVEWDGTGKRLYETGIDRAMLYLKNSGAYTGGVAWNGITSISESPSGAEETALYADNIKYLSLRSVEELGLSIEAYTYPDEWAQCDGSAVIGSGLMLGQQSRKTFGLSYRTNVGDEDSDELGYKIHLIYNCTASPSQRSYQTINDSPEAISFSWEVNTTTEKISGTDYKGAASITIDTTKLDGGKENANLILLEQSLYGTAVGGDVYAVDATDTLTNLYTIGTTGDDKGKFVSAGTLTERASGTTYYTKTAQTTTASSPVLPSMATVIGMFN